MGPPAHLRLEGFPYDGSRSGAYNGLQGGTYSGLQIGSQGGPPAQDFAGIMRNLSAPEPAAPFPESANLPGSKPAPYQTERPPEPVAAPYAGEPRSGEPAPAPASAGSEIAQKTAQEQAAPDRAEEAPDMQALRKKAAIAGLNRAEAGQEAGQEALAKRSGVEEPALAEGFSSEEAADIVAALLSGGGKAGLNPENGKMVADDALAGRIEGLDAAGNGLAAEESDAVGDALSGEFPGGRLFQKTAAPGDGAAEAPVSPELPGQQA
jgi:hypothetical protein